MKLLMIAALIGLGATAAIDEHIVGGAEVTPGAIPHQGYINSGASGCGSTLISANWAITAAHCVTLAANQYQNNFGVHDRSDGSIGEPAVYETRQYIRNPGYDGVGSTGYQNDLAVMETMEEVQMGDYVKTVRLANPGEDFTGQMCTVSGWGRLCAGCPLSDVLLEAKCEVLSTQECQGFYSGTLVGDLHHICCVNRGETVHLCNGDSGGPLTCGSEATGYVVAGTASWGTSTCDPAMPSVFVKMSNQRNFICSATGVGC